VHQPGEGPNVINEQIGHFEGGEVTASRLFVPVPTL
jgi:hypothetical protein